jgi:ribosomal protein L11 methyltransferase
MTETTRRFLQILVDVPEALGELAGLLAEEAGARGVEIRDATTLPPPGAEPPPEGRVHVVAWLDPGVDTEALFARLTADLEAGWRRLGAPSEAATHVSFATVDAEDWVRKVRDAIQPVVVGRRIVVRPTWSKAPADAPDGSLEVVLDPGLAFGTGHHATTSLCLEGLEALLDDARARGEAPTVLDVGTGSGILAIAAAKLGASRCTGLDNDPMAVRVAGENAVANGVAGAMTVTAEDPASVGGTFDLVVANIHLGPLTELAPSVAPRVAEGGRLLLSGLLEDQADAAEAAYAAEGLRPASRRTRDGWALVVLTRP